MEQSFASCIEKNLISGVNSESRTASTFLGSDKVFTLSVKEANYHRTCCSHISAASLTYNVFIIPFRLDGH